MKLPRLLTRDVFERAETRLQTRFDSLFMRLDSLGAMFCAELARPKLATMTILCERQRLSMGRSEEPRRLHADVTEWVPTCLGGEVWIRPRETQTLVLYPQYLVRNLRWFVSGDPEIVVESLKVGPEVTDAGFGSLKFGDWQGVCNLGTHITATIARRVP